MHLENVFAPGRLAGFLPFPRRRFWLCVAFVLLAVPLIGWILRAPSAHNLEEGRSIASAGLFTAWAQGNAMVVMRHAERCDRSHDECLGDPDGITVEGVAAAATAGRALRALGLETTDFLSSPLVRTVQTAQALTGRDVPTVEWLQDCRRPSLPALLALKKPGRNLVVVTHSGCIEHYEQQLGVGGTPSSGYASALFLSNIHDDSANVLGYLDASGWRTLLDQATKSK